MDSKSLMIGDWVRIKDSIAPDDAYWMHDNLHPGQAIRIEEILSYGINPDWYGGEINDYIPEDAIEPIPLTAEILEKNGFRNIGGHWYDDAADYYELEIEAYSDSIWRVIYHNTEFNIGDERVFVSHIHELQHALRLFGIKKEIEL